VALGDKPFVGGEAVASGVVRKHELRSRFRAVFPDVYVEKNVPLTIHARASAAWLWAHRHGVIAGLTASALHGAKWISDSEPIELIWQNNRCPPGLRTSDMQLRAGEFAKVSGLPVTTPARTAFDIGRRGALDAAVARLDALGNATGVTAQEVHRVERDHPGVRGLRQLRTALALFDGGAASPKETWLRLLIVRAGYPRPKTQIRVLDSHGYPRYYLDMGWEELKIAAEYDGDQHRTDRPQYVKDIRRREELTQMGWVIVQVVAEDRRSDILRRLRHAWDARTR
jgi:hypothetical protein